MQRRIPRYVVKSTYFRNAYWSEERQAFVDDWELVTVYFKAEAESIASSLTNAIAVSFG